MTTCVLCALNNTQIAERAFAFVICRCKYLVIYTFGTFFASTEYCITTVISHEIYRDSTHG